jgi:hypothetical protein
VFHDHLTQKPSTSGTMLFFQSFAFGIMIEDGVGALWRKLTGPKSPAGSGYDVPIWQRLIGFTWVVFWFTIFRYMSASASTSCFANGESPFYMYPAQLSPIENGWILPYSIAENFGVQYVGAAIGLLSVGILLCLKPEL